MEMVGPRLGAAWFFPHSLTATTLPCISTAGHRLRAAATLQPTERFAAMTPDSMTLYPSPASPNSRRVRIFVGEKGLMVPPEAVHLSKGEQHSEAYRKVNAR